MSHPEPSPAYERRDTAVRTVLLVTAGLAVFTVLIVLLSGGLLRLFEGQAERAERPAPRWETAAPRAPLLQTDPGRQWTEVRAAQEARARRYRWIDPEAGTVQVPLDRALELVLDEGLPAREPKDGEETEEEER